MIAVTDILLATVVFVAGFVGGRISKRGGVVEADPNACGCGHSRGFHEKGTGSCKERMRNGYTCRCQTWDGPDRPEDILKGFQG